MLCKLKTLRCFCLSTKTNFVENNLLKNQRTNPKACLFCIQNRHNSNSCSKTLVDLHTETSVLHGDLNALKEIGSDMMVYKHFITDTEEKSLMAEINPYMKRLRYEFDHWDNAIHGYRETERRTWNTENEKILNKVKDIAFPPGVSPLAYVHILDLDEKGYIKPHVDAVRFCGTTIAGLCLLSPCVMKLVHCQQPEKTVDIFLDRLSLYIMKGIARYDYTHEVLSNENSFFNGVYVPKTRRISVVMRNEPMDEKT